MSTELTKMKVRWMGMRPLLMHNGILADPTHPLVKEIKKITGKKKKTDDDYEKLAELEWMASLYWDDKHGLIMPSDNIERCIQLGAQKSKIGKDVQACCFVSDEVVVVNYDGPKTKEAMYSDPRFVLRKGVRVTNNRVIRCRPMIPSGWSIEFTMEFDKGIVNKEALEQAMRDAGALIGLGDWRPKFGRFFVEILPYE